MRKITILLLAAVFSLAAIIPAHASFVLSNAPAAEEAEAVATTEALHQGNLGDLSAEQILALTPESFKEMTGQKMNFKQRFVLKYVQKNIKRDLKKEGTVDVKRYFDDGDRRFNLGGFALGFLLGLIGVALAHIFSNNKSFRRSSWYGVGALIIIAIIAALAGGN